MQLEFFHEDGQRDIEGELEGLISSASVRLRVVIAFVTGPGADLIMRHIDLLARQGSFLVCSVSTPTDLDAVARISKVAPGSVYVHTGGVVPEERKVGRALMHSKVVLAESDTEAILWVGSHNLTGSALAGANFEAAMRYRAELNNSVIRAAGSHVERCRTEAEVFAASRLPVYEAMQGSHLSSALTKRDVLTVHAEARTVPTVFPYFVDVRLPTSHLDQLVAPDMKTHLYLHPHGSLSGLGSFSSIDAILHEGRTTGVIQGEKNQDNAGTLADLSRASHRVSANGVPRFEPAVGRSTSGVTQVVVRIDSSNSRSAEVTSISGGSLNSPKEITPKEGSMPVRVSERHPHWAPYFTSESFEGDALVYQPAWGVKRTVKLESFHEQDPELVSQAERTEQSRVPGLEVKLQPRVLRPPSPLHRFVYVSRYDLQLTLTEYRPESLPGDEKEANSRG